MRPERSRANAQTETARDLSGRLHFSAHTRGSKPRALRGRAFSPDDCSSRLQSRSIRKILPPPKIDETRERRLHGSCEPGENERGNNGDGGGAVGSRCCRRLETLMLSPVGQRPGRELCGFAQHRHIRHALSNQNAASARRAWRPWRMNCPTERGRT